MNSTSAAIPLTTAAGTFRRDLAHSQSWSRYTGVPAPQARRFFKPGQDPAERLYVLQAFPPRLISMNTDGTDRRTVVANLTGTPDGLTVDLARGHLYWTNMGAKWDQEDGFIERVNLDGSDRTTIVPKGGTFTPKQIVFEPTTDRLYWSDREGMRVMSSDRNGHDITVLVETGSTEEHRRDRRRHCVGIAVDPQAGYIYWTQKGPNDGNAGRILRAGLDLPAHADPSSREDIEILFDNLPEPIDLLLDCETDTLYWTDRGKPPLGNTLNAADVGPDGCSNHRILLEGLKEGISVCANGARDTLFVTDLVLGHIRRLDLDVPHKAQTIRRGWPLTGIVCVPAAA